MKIENNNMLPITPKKTESATSVSKKSAASDAAAVGKARDKAELSESARLLAKARVAVEELSDVENERVELLRQQIQDGSYSIPYDQLAKKLISRLYPKE